MKQATFPIYFFLRGVYIFKKVYSIWLWAAGLGWWELGNILGLGKLGLWADNPFDLVYELEKIFHLTSFVISPILSDIFRWRTLDRQVQVTPWQRHPKLFLQGTEQSPRLSGPFKTPAQGCCLSCFLSQPNGQSPSLQTCFQLAAFSLGYFQFSYITVLWNFWSWSVVAAPSLEVFKARLDGALV